MNEFLKRQLTRYGNEGIAYANESKNLAKYIENKSVGNEHTARTYRARLSMFAYFLFKEGKAKVSLDKSISNIKEPYEVLQSYAAFLKSNGFKANEIREKTKTAKRFLRFCKVKINSEDFREFVTLPKKERPEFVPTEKSQITELLSGCDNLRLKTALMMMASTGARAEECCAIKLSDVDLEARKITFSAEFTKTKTERTRPITKELAKQISAWLTFKHRKRRIVSKKPDGSGWLTRWVQPERKQNDYLLAFYRGEGKIATPSGLYDALYDEWQSYTNRVGMKRKNGKRVITFHRFRAFVKTTLSNLGYADFSEWYIGHAGSTYYRTTETEIRAISEKVEPYLTFLDLNALEARQRDLISQVEEAKDALNEQVGLYYDENQALKEFIAKLAEKTGVEVPKDLLKD